MDDEDTTSDGADDPRGELPVDVDADVEPGTDVDLEDEKEDEDEDDIVVMSVLQRYATEAEALLDARELVEHGVGATVVPVPADAEIEEGEERGTYQIEVLPIDVVRGERVLGIVEHDTIDLTNPPKLEKGPVPWKTLLLVWLAAMIIVPALAFYLAYSLAAK